MSAPPTLDALGPNAVTTGLAQDRALSTAGEEHTAPLQSLALYFAPITLLGESPPYEKVRHGGIAIFLPEELRHPDYLLTAFAVANDMILHLHTGNTIFSLYEGLGQGLLIFDINQYNQQAYTVYHNKGIFDILGVPPTDIYFRPAEEFFDPPPQNQELWDTIRERRQLAGHPMTLRVRGGREVDCIVATESHYQPSLNTRDIRFFITTPQKASEQIFNKIGNSAILNFENIVGQAPLFRSAVQRGRMLANTDSNIMLLGESGAGKDIFAQAIHNTSARRNKPFIALNCGALPRDLISSELFGYESGAFTGAKRQGNLGKFELANGGTLFLDENGELQMDLQATLLWVVENKQFMRLGGSKPIQIDVKIICATNADIPAMIAHKTFREDLYYRLSTMRLTIPPLRARQEDILLLAQHFIRAISARIGRTNLPKFSPEARAVMLSYPWPGNVRELQNLMESVVQLYPDDPSIRPEYLYENLTAAASPREDAWEQSRITRRGLLTQEEIAAALERCGGNRSEAARRLGIARKTLYRNMERLGM